MICVNSIFYDLFYIAKHISIVQRKIAVNEMHYNYSINAMKNKINPHTFIYQSIKFYAFIKYVRKGNVLNSKVLYSKMCYHYKHPELQREKKTYGGKTKTFDKLCTEKALKQVRLNPDAHVSFSGRTLDEKETRNKSRVKHV